MANTKPSRRDESASSPTEAIEALQASLADVRERVVRLEEQHGALVLNMPKREVVLTRTEVEQRIREDKLARFRVVGPPEGHHSHGVGLAVGRETDARQFPGLPSYVSAGLQLVAAEPA